MGLSVAQGSFQWAAGDTVGTIKTVTPGFVAKVVKVWCNGLDSATDTTSTTLHSRLGVGWGSSTTSRACLGTVSEDAEGTADCGTAVYNDCVLGIPLSVNTAGSTTPGPDGKLDINDIGTDNDIDFIVDDQIAVNVRVHWIAWGGTDITNVSVATESTGTATGNLTISTPGFQGNFAWFAVSKALTAGTGTDDESWSFGAATGSANQAVTSGFANDGANTMQTTGYCRSDECMAAMVADAAVEFRASFVQFESTGYTINRIENASGTARVFIAVVIKGGQWFVDSFTTSVTDSATIERTQGFQASSVCVYGCGRAQSTADTPTGEMEAMIGAALSTTDRQSTYSGDDDGIGTSFISLAVEYDEVYVNSLISAGTVEGLMDISAIGATSITYIMDNGDDAANFVWTFSSAPNAAAETITVDKWAPQLPDPVEPPITMIGYH